MCLWYFSIYLWGVFLCLISVGWEYVVVWHILMILFAIIIIADAFKKKPQDEQKPEESEDAQQLMEGEEPADYEIVKVSVVSSRPQRTKKKVTETTKKAKKKPSEKNIDDKLADLEQEIDKLSHEIKGAKDTDFPSATDEAQPAEQIERLSQKLSAQKAEHHSLPKQ